MDRLRWRIVRVDDRLVRVLREYCEPGEQWDLLAGDSDAKASFAPWPDRSTGASLKNGFPRKSSTWSNTDPAGDYAPRIEGARAGEKRDRRYRVA